MGHAELKDQYVILTGAKNNAGDYLIKHRAKALFSALRPERRIIDLNGWEPLTPDHLNEINVSRALILTGGPAIQPGMYPNIYPLVEDLSQIKPPILTMSLGWKSVKGFWDATYDYPLSKDTLVLLDRVAASGYQSSVRDYHTLSVLHSKGYGNFLMTGCTALYTNDQIDREHNYATEPKRVSFSLGTSFYKTKRLAEANRHLILSMRDAFPDAQFTVVFHHATTPSLYRRTHNPNLRLMDEQLGLIHWLEGQEISWVDISGDADSMEAHYGNCDLHVGYRVHAHILMTSVLKPSVLIAEDGRGTALREVLGGIVFDGCFRPIPGFMGKVARRLGYFGESLMASKTLPESIVKEIRYEIGNRFPRLAGQRENINAHFRIMKTFIKQLP